MLPMNAWGSFKGVNFEQRPDCMDEVNQASAGSGHWTLQASVGGWILF